MRTATGSISWVYRRRAQVAKAEIEPHRAFAVHDVRTSPRERRHSTYNRHLVTGQPRLPLGVRGRQHLLALPCRPCALLGTQGRPRRAVVEVLTQAASAAVRHTSPTSRHLSRVQIFPVRRVQRTTRPARPRATGLVPARPASVRPPAQRITSFKPHGAKCHSPAPWMRRHGPGSIRRGRPGC